jgi:glycosyltransferase involved in cell wall biosynthesis
MRILMQSRTTLFSAPGGDTIQILKTKEYLEKLGLQCSISLDIEADLRGYDVVHLFNLMRPQEVYLQALNAKQQGKPLALSTIYGLYTEYERRARPLLARILTNLLSPWQIEHLKVFARAITAREYHKGTQFVLRYGYKTLSRKILDLCDIVLPNSHSEMRRIEQNFGIANIPFAVVPNAVDYKLFDVDRFANSKEQPFSNHKNCVLCVAQIAGRKNQLNLIKAVHGAPYKLVLVGRPSPHHKQYARKVQQEAPPNVRLIGQIEHDLLPAIYYQAKVHVLPSWMESPGLASLEAGAMNCNLVVTTRGDTEEYFGDRVYYCEPDSIESIRSAIDKAWEEPVNPGLRQHILGNFTWEKAARNTLAAYQDILPMCKSAHT